MPLFSGYWLYQRRMPGACAGVRALSVCEHECANARQVWDLKKKLKKACNPGTRAERASGAEIKGLRTCEGSRRGAFHGRPSPVHLLFLCLNGEKEIRIILLKYAGQLPELSAGDHHEEDCDFHGEMP